jgi:hypothetical protein
MSLADRDSVSEGEIILLALLLKGRTWRGVHPGDLVLRPDNTVGIPPASRAIKRSHIWWLVALGCGIRRDGELLVVESLPPACRHKTLQAWAHARYKRALSRRTLVPPAQCSVCGERGKIVGHHEDYESPLAVQWLCVRCHRRRHAAGGFPADSRSVPPPMVTLHYREHARRCVEIDLPAYTSPLAGADRERWRSAYSAEKRAYRKNNA